MINKAASGRIERPQSRRLRVEWSKRGSRAEKVTGLKKRVERAEETGRRDLRLKRP